MPTCTITITVNPGPPKTLSYTLTGAGGSTNGPKSHRVFRNCDLVFACAAGDFAIQFTGNRAPFTNNVKGKDLSVSATSGNTTAPLTTKNNLPRRKVKYMVAVAGQVTPPIVTEDPDMEDGGDPGGPPEKSKKAPKRKAPSKSKKKAKR